MIGLKKSSMISYDDRKRLIESDMSVLEDPQVLTCIENLKAAALLGRGRIINIITLLTKNM